MTTEKPVPENKVLRLLERALAQTEAVIAAIRPGDRPPHTLRRLGCGVPCKAPRDAGSAPLHGVSPRRDTGLDLAANGPGPRLGRCVFRRRPAASGIWSSQDARRARSGARRHRTPLSGVPINRSVNWLCTLGILPWPLVRRWIWIRSLPSTPWPGPKACCGPSTAGQTRPLAWRWQFRRAHRHMTGLPAGSAVILPGARRADNAPAAPQHAKQRRRPGQRPPDSASPCMPFRLGGTGASGAASTTCSRPARRHRPPTPAHGRWQRPSGRPGRPSAA